MSKRPAFQFYPGDWRTDPGLRLCSIAARGLWIEMMTLMHEGEPYGHLTVQSRPIGADMLARLCGESASTVKRLLKELEANEVYSVTAGGVAFSRRMVRDEEARERRIEGGKAGGEHGYKGASHGAKGGRPRKQETPLAANGRGVLETPSEPPPSSSSSSPSPDKVPLDKSNGASVDSDKAFWDTAKAKLGPSKATLIGKWSRDYGKAETASAITAAQVERAVDPVSYIAATLRSRGASEAMSPC
jgi:hypothetical protein